MTDTTEKHYIIVNKKQILDGTGNTYELGVEEPAKLMLFLRDKYGRIVSSRPIDDVNDWANVSLKFFE